MFNQEDVLPADRQVVLIRLDHVIEDRILHGLIARHFGKILMIEKHQQGRTDNPDCGPCQRSGRTQGCKVPDQGSADGGGRYIRRARAGWADRDRICVQSQAEKKRSALCHGAERMLDRRNRKTYLRWRL